MTPGSARKFHTQLEAATGPPSKACVICKLRPGRLGFWRLCAWAVGSSRSSPPAPKNTPRQPPKGSRLAHRSSLRRQLDCPIKSPPGCRGRVEDELRIVLQRHVEKRRPQRWGIEVGCPFDPVGVADGPLKIHSEINLRIQKTYGCRRGITVQAGEPIGGSSSFNSTRAD